MFDDVGFAAGEGVEAEVAVSFKERSGMGACFPVQGSELFRCYRDIVGQHMRQIGGGHGSYMKRTQRMGAIGEGGDTDNTASGLFDE